MKMKKISLMFAFLLMFSLSIVNAAEIEIRFYDQIDTNVTIYEKCRVNGDVCGSEYNCSLTILSPSQEIVIDEQLMNGIGPYRNYTLNDNQSKFNGIYEATVDCSNGALFGSNTFFYEITPNGAKPIDEGQGLVMLGGIFLLLLLSSSMGILGIRMKNEVVGLGFLAFSILLMAFTLGLIFNLIQLSLGAYPEVVGNYSSLYVLFTVLVTVGAIGLILYIIVKALNMYWKMRGIKDVFTVKD